MKISDSDPAVRRLLRGRVLNGIVDFTIVALAVMPLLLTPHIPLTDLPNHLARQYIFRDLATSPALQAFYEIHWDIVPNLALEIFVLIAKFLLPLDQAVRAYCVITIVMLFFGVKGVNQALGGSESRIYRVAPLLFYGAPFQFGFLSFCFGVGLALLACWLYLHLRPRIGSWITLALIFAPLAFALLLCHLVAFGVFAIAIGSIELNRGFEDAGGWNRRLVRCLLVRQMRIASFLLPALFLFEILSPVAGSHGTRFGTLYQKAESLAALMLFSSPATELPLLLVAAVGLVGALLVGFVQAKRSTIIMAVVFTAVWLALPRVLLGAGYVDLRVFWAASFFLVAGLVPGQQYERLATGFGALFGTLVLARIALIAWFWLSWEPTLSAIDSALNGLPTGARLMVVIGDLKSVSQSRRPPLDHVAAYAVARRQAFEPGLFASISGHLLYFREPYNDLAMIPPSTSIDKIAPQYNYLLVLHPEAANVDSRLPLRCQQSGRYFALLQIASSAEARAANLSCMRARR